jgi:hypothetical protein
MGFVGWWWRRRVGSKLEKFEDYRWKAVAADDLLLLTRTEGQVWLALLNLLLDPVCRKHYQYNTHRKNIIVGVPHSITSTLTSLLFPSYVVLASLRHCTCAVASLLQ